MKHSEVMGCIDKLVFFLKDAPRNITVDFANTIELPLLRFDDKIDLRGIDSRAMYFFQKNMPDRFYEQLFYYDINLCSVFLNINYLKSLDRKDLRLKNELKKEFKTQARQMGKTIKASDLFVTDVYNIHKASVYNMHKASESVYWKSMPNLTRLLSENFQEYVKYVYLDKFPEPKFSFVAPEELNSLKFGIRVNGSDILSKTENKIPETKIKEKPKDILAITKRFCK